MLRIKTFIFNPFQENTYLVSDDSGETIIIDPGCSSDRENQEVSNYLETENLKLTKLLCTHLHVDHVLGNAFINKKYGLNPMAHYNDQDIYNLAKEQAQMFGLAMENEPPSIKKYIEEGEEILLGKNAFKVLYVPGHSLGGICFYSPLDKIVFVGDCLFSGSIGRTDLWGGDQEQLLSRIHSELLSLPPDTVVYSGHGPSTTIGEEKLSNPFLQS